MAHIFPMAALCNCSLFIFCNLNGPNSPKWNNFSPPSCQEFIKSMYIIVKYVKSSAVSYCSSQYSVFQLVTSLQNITGKKSSLWSQTYSWNECGLKLFHFREYGPLCWDTLQSTSIIIFFKNIVRILLLCVFLWTKAEWQKFKKKLKSAIMITLKEPFQIYHYLKLS